MCLWKQWKREAEKFAFQVSEIYDKDAKYVLDIRIFL